MVRPQFPHHALRRRTWCPRGLFSADNCQYSPAGVGTPRQQGAGPAQRPPPGQGQGSAWLEKGGQGGGPSRNAQEARHPRPGPYAERAGQVGPGPAPGAEKKDGFTPYCPEPRKHAEALSREATRSRQEVGRWQLRTKEDSLACGAAPVAEG